jgi:RNA polymerase sigma factor (sigma-70 family)
LGYSKDRVEIVHRFHLAQSIINQCDLEGDWEIDHLGPYESHKMSYDDNDLWNKVNVFIEDLTEREKEVMNLRFGINGYQQMSLRETGAFIGLSQEMVRKIQDRVLESFKVIKGIADETD